MNIGDIDDASYRYKMPAIISMNEGSGNGVKTVILNIEEISRALYRDSTEIGKYLSLEMNTPMKYKKKEKRMVFNGQFTKSQLMECLKEYIKQYIICELCSLPETHYKIKKNIRKLCDACGHREKVSGNEKLNKYIKKQACADS